MPWQYYLKKSFILYSLVILFKMGADKNSPILFFQINTFFQNHERIGFEVSNHSVIQDEKIPR